MTRMNVKSLRSRIDSPAGAYGIFCDIVSAQVVEMIGLSGFDYVIIDAEHTTASLADVEHQVRAAEVRGVSSIVRVASHRHSEILRHLDTGAEGILVPLVRNAADAASIVEAVKYPPLGTRGLAHVRAARYGIGVGLGDYATAANERAFIAIQIECAEAVRNFDSIVAVEGIDAIFFGATDLASSLGIGSNLKTSGSYNPEIVALIADMGRKALAAGKQVGASAHSRDVYEHWAGLGFRMNATVASLQLARALAGAVSDCRASRTANESL